MNVTENMMRRPDSLHHSFPKHFAATVISIGHQILSILLKIESI